MTGNITPETDASCGYALSSHYGRLEGSYLQMDRSGPFVHAEVARIFERERDEAREKLSEWENAALHVEADHPDEKHCGCVPVLRKLLADAREKLDKEMKWHHQTHSELVQTQCKLLDMQMGRDEIQGKYDNLATEHMLAINKICNERDILRLDAQKEDQHHDRMVGELERIYAERDDALNQIQGWENKWKVAVDMAAIAENKVSNLEDQLDLSMKTIKRLEVNQP